MEKTRERKLWKDTPKRKFARRRNWMLFKIAGYDFSLSDCLSTNETILMMKMRDLRNQLISSWDKESIKVGLTPSKKKNDKD